MREHGNFDINSSYANYSTVHEACDLDRKAREVWDSGDRSGAIKLLEQALSISPEATIALRLSRYLKHDQQDAASLVTMGYAYARSPRRNEIAYEFAQMLFESGAVVRAREVVDEILLRCPDEAKALRMKQEMGGDS